MDNNRLLILSGLILATLLLAGCGGQAAEPAAVAPTAAEPTAVPPTDISPTATPVPPTATPVPPTETPEPTATAIPIAPSARGYVTLAYDTESDLMVLFGGQTGSCCDASSFSGTTWIYDVTAYAWSKQQPAVSPSARAAAAMAYDSESDRVVLFGGADHTSLELNDTWAYDYNTDTWEQLASGPPDHLGPRLAYDAESDQVILFGGFDFPSASPRDDTWAYDYNSDTWTEMKPATSPTGRNYQGMTYDAESDRVLVWGGTGTALKPVDGSVWAYDYNSNTWEKMPLTEPVPGPRDYPVMVYDAESDRTILYGGFPVVGDETWAYTWAYDYNSNTWTQMNPAVSPPKLSRHAMAYSDDADRVILFGGQEGITEFYYTRETWSYDFNSDTWKKVWP